MTSMEELNNTNNEDEEDDQSSVEDNDNNNKHQNGGRKLPGNPTSNKRKRNQPEWEQLQKGQKLLKKFKKGKITKTELEEEMDETFD